MSWLDFPIIPSKESTADFKELIKKHYNTTYTDEEAYEGAYNLLNVFRVLIMMDKKHFLARKKVIETLKQILYKKTH